MGDETMEEACVFLQRHRRMNGLVGSCRKKCSELRNMKKVVASLTKERGKLLSAMQYFIGMHE